MGHVQHKYTKAYFLKVDDNGKPTAFGVEGLEEFKRGDIRTMDKDILKRINFSGCNVLEFGFGRGEALKYAAYHGAANVVGVDFSNDACDIAKGFLSRYRIDADIYCDDALNFIRSYFGKKERKIFDVVLMLDFVEHVPRTELAEVLKQIHPLLSSNAVVAINTPVFPVDNDIITEGIKEESHDSSDNFEETSEMHCNRYTKESLRSFMESCGFSALSGHFFIEEPRQLVSLEQAVEGSYPLTEYAIHEKETFEFVKPRVANLHPTVSIVVPSYNSAHWLPYTIESILNQTFQDWEAIIVNDGSTDNTKELIAQYEKRDPRVRSVHKENGGISSALNAGIDAARGKYFCWLSSDDLFYPDKLEQQVQAFQTLSDNVAIMFGQFDHIDADGKVTQLQQSKEFVDGLEFAQFLRYDYIDGCTIMIPMNIMREAGGFNVQYKHAQDTELWFRLAAKGYSFHYLPRKITCRRIHPEQGFRDFGLDCRFDGFWMTDFYLSHYSFRDFYRKLDFSNDDQVRLFIKHFFDIVIDSNCNVNHSTVIQKFWNWFVTGLATLAPNVRNRIIAHGKYIFTETKSQGAFYENYLQRFLEIEKKQLGKKSTQFQISDQFHDITKFNKAGDKDFTGKLKEYGVRQLSIGERTVGTTVFKYLSDEPNPFQEEAFRKFFELTFTQGRYDQYVRAFRRKPNFAQLSEDIKTSYAFALIALQRSDEEIERAVGFVGNENYKMNLESFRKGSISSVSLSSIVKWNFHVEEYSIRHELEICCEKCQKTFSCSTALEISQSHSDSIIVCTNCYSALKFSDERIAEYFNDKNSSLQSLPKPKTLTPNVAIVMRYSNVGGGGVKKMLQHAEWLEKLGCKVTVYSDAPAPSWRKVPGKFVQVKDHYEVPAGIHDSVVCMCNYDVPKMLTKYPKENVALFCQGYEGYHIGRTYDELRSDKHFYTALHSLAANKFVISHHLVNMFKDKFGDECYYVPNGVMHSIFYPDLKIQKEANSILFIGNPSDPLKGLKYLTTTLEEIQKSEFKIDGLTLHVVFGGTGKNKLEHFQLPGFAVEYHEGLTGNEIAQMVNKVELVVNTSWYEGFSLPVLEALACGIPVVTTNNMGAESFCEDGKNAFVVKFGDMNRLGNIVINVLGHKDDLTGMIRNGLETAIEYSEENSVKRFIDSYSQFLGVQFPQNNVERLISETGRKNVSHRNGFAKVEFATPTFSVLVPTYNQAEFLPETLESLRAQTYTNWEAVVVNDGSTDNTKSVAERYALFDRRIRVFHKQNGGVATALNEGLKNAKGEWICWLSSDDLFEPEKLKIHLDEIQKKPASKFFHTFYYGLNNATGKKVAVKPNEAKDLPSNEDHVISFFYTNYINGITICIHRSVFEKVGGFNALLRNGQDFDMWLRIASKFSINLIEKRTCAYRVHPNQGASKFPEAGEYDSSLACGEFLNRNPFESVFPFVDLNRKEIAFKACEKTIAVAIDEHSYVNRLGFGYLLINRMHEWISQQCPIEFKNELINAFKPLEQQLVNMPVSQNLRDAVHSLIDESDREFYFKPIDVIAVAEHNGTAKAVMMDQAGSEPLLRYLARLQPVHVDLKETSSIDNALVLIQNKKYQEAIDILRTEDNESEYLHNIRGCAYLGLQDLEHAKESFEQVLKINPESAEACAGLGEVFYLAELDEHAKTMFEWAIKHDPNNKKSVQRLSEINKALGFEEHHTSLEEISVGV